MPSKTSRRFPSRPSHLHRAAQMGVGVGVAATSAGLLAAAPAAAISEAPAGLLKQGSDSPQVIQVQRALHLPGSGRFGPKTRRAVRVFQRRDGLIVDGIVGVQTWDALFGLAPPTVSSSSSTTGSRGVGYSSGGGYSIPSGIVQCESGGNYSAVNSSSGAGGAYQIMPSTWQAYGGRGLPQDAPGAEQDRIAGEIYAHQGPGAWTC
jgi:peptidoglycan hydrolase-like protein with peptidoglycan-binding domain